MIGKFSCPGCGAKLRAADDQAEGESVRCPKCDKVFVLTRMLVEPYCYKCEIPEVVVFLKIPTLGWVYGCSEHQDIAGFWLMPNKPYP